MSHSLKTVLLLSLSCILSTAAQADVVTDWNSTIRQVMQNDGTNLVNKANPGWATRSIAMMNGAIYDVFQAIDRTHAPFLVNTAAPAGASLEAAVHQAAYDLLLHCYPGEQSILDAAYNDRMGLIAGGDAKTNGMNLGQAIAQQYMDWRTGDNADTIYPYTPGSLPGEWREDPYNPGQVAWGPGWRHVDPFAIPNSGDFVNALTPIPALDSQAYADAFNQVKEYGELNSASRSPDQEAMGLFWAYDRPSMGPPPVLFVRNLEEISAQAGNTPEQNARLFALASVSMADAAIAAWDSKFEYNFWRPVTAIHEAGDGTPGDADGNENTEGDDTWRPLGAPGADHGDFTDDFTPPFPAWTSGHATMGGALYKAIELFYGTNVFDEIDGMLGNNLLYELTSEEEGSGTSRYFSSFTQSAFLDVDAEDSPEGENGMSRIYLGIHWGFDQRDGIDLGNSIAQYIAAGRFQAVPEPGALVLALMGLAGVGGMNRRGRQGLA